MSVNPLKKPPIREVLRWPAATASSQAGESPRTSTEIRARRFALIVWM
jgi:hypothetical protein